MSRTADRTRRRIADVGTSLLGSRPSRRIHFDPNPPVGLLQSCPTLGRPPSVWLAQGSRSRLPAAVHKSWLTLASVVAFIGDLVGDDQVMLGVYRRLNAQGAG